MLLPVFGMAHGISKGGLWKGYRVQDSKGNEINGRNESAGACWG